MSGQYALKINPEQAKEMPMVDLAFEVLKAANNPYYYRDLMQEVARIKGLSDEEMMGVIAQLYTEINIDGRFACVGTNLWGLKRWYPVEKSEDSVGTAKHPRIINDDDDDDDYFAEEEETYAEGEDYEAFESEDEYAAEDDDFYQDEETIEDAEIDEADEEIEAIDEESDDEDEFADSEEEDDEEEPDEDEK